MDHAIEVDQMIRYDGYYRTEPSPYEDSAANFVDKGYFHNAYMFTPDEIFLRGVKKLPISECNFELADFEDDRPNKYQVNGTKLIMTFHTGEEWEFTETFEITLNDRLKSEKRELYFVPFDEKPL